MDDYVSKPLRRVEFRAALDRAAAIAMSRLDDDVLRTLREDGEDEFSELVDLFIASAPTALAHMNRALATTESAGLVIAAHTLKGSCSNFGGSSLRHLCAQIEQVGRVVSWVVLPTLSRLRKRN